MRFFLSLILLLYKYLIKKASKSQLLWFELAPKYSSIKYLEPDYLRDDSKNFIKLWQLVVKFPCLLYILFFQYSVWGHPHSTYTQRGKRGVKPNAYDCAQGGGVVSRLRTYAKRIFWKNLKTFLCLYQRSYYIVIYFCV